MKMLGSASMVLVVAIGWLLPVPAESGACYDCGIYCELLCVQGECWVECVDVCVQDLWDGSHGCRTLRAGDLWVCFPEGSPCHIYRT